MQNNFDIIFLISGKPLPAMLDMAYQAEMLGKKSLMIILERGIEDLTIDQSLINYEVETIEVKYKSVDIKRVLSIPSQIYKLRNKIYANLKNGGIIYASTYDLLLYSVLLNYKSKFRIRYQIRDLHKYQLVDNIIGKVFSFVERVLLKRVEKVVVSSQGFIDGYYKKIYKGSIVLLENTPAEKTWQNFISKRRGQTFVIGFIGIIRYEKSLLQLIKAIEILNQTNPELGIRGFFAGGGNNDFLRKHASNHSLFEVEGPYEYTKDIKRLYSKIDLIFSVYDSYDLNCQLAMPNKFYESIISKIPIIVAKQTYLESIVNEYCIGTSVLSGDTEELIEKLLELKNNNSWYQKALETLQSKANDANLLFEKYNQSMINAIV